MQNDPYSTPISHDSTSGRAGSSEVSQAVMLTLAGTKPWVRFFSVLMFVGAGLLLLVALVMAVAGASIGKASGNPMFSGGMGVGIAVIYGLLSIIYVYPGMKLWKYSNSIRNLLQTSAEVDLIDALNQQRAFWKFIGILFLSLLALYILIIIAAVVFGGFAAMSAR